MPGRSRSWGHAKDGPDPTFNPCSFSFVWSHIWAKFPLLSWAKRKSSGWVEGGSGPLLPSRVNSRNTVDPWVTKPGRERTYIQTPIQCSLVMMTSGMSQQYQSFRDTCERGISRWVSSVLPALTASNGGVKVRPLNTVILKIISHHFRRKGCDSLQNYGEVALNCSLFCWPRGKTCLHSRLNKLSSGGGS